MKPIPDGILRQLEALSTIFRAIIVITILWILATQGIKTWIMYTISAFGIIYMYLPILQHYNEVTLQNDQEKERNNIRK